MDQSTEINNLCRICLKENDETAQWLFKTNQSAKKPLKFSQMLMEFAEIQVQFGDGLPLQICSNCAEATIKVYLFKKKCEKSDRILRNRLENKRHAEECDVIEIPDEENLNLKVENVNQEQEEDCVLIDTCIQQNANDVLEKSLHPVQSQCDTCQKNVARINELLLQIKITKLSHQIKMFDQKLDFEANKIRINKHNNMYDESVEDKSLSSLKQDVSQVLVLEHDDDMTITYNYEDKKDSLCSSITCDKSLNKVEPSSHQHAIDFEETNLPRKSKEDKIYECDVCKRRFLRAGALALHKFAHGGRKRVKRIRTGEKPCKCNICKKRFANLCSLKVHKRTHTGEKPFKCVVCKKEFRHLTTLTNHKRTHTGEKPFKCVVCKKEFRHVTTLKIHKQTHSGEKPYKCNICRKRFANLWSLNVHKRTHTGEKPFKCVVCKKEFRHLTTLTNHKRTHTGEKPFKCVVCKKEFRHVTTLKIHKQTHSGEKPYKCNICRKSFANLWSLKVHKRTHTGEKPFKCVVCKKEFRHLTTLTNHKRTHTGEKPFKCVVCKKEFRHVTTLKIHKRTHSGEKNHTNVIQ